MAEKYGLVLLENGTLVDTAVGQTVPHDVLPMPRTSVEQVSSMHVPSPNEAEALIWRNRATAETDEIAIIGPAAPLHADNDIRMSRIDVHAGAHFDLGVARAPEVVFVHEGTAELLWADGALTLAAGDTITVPIGLPHRIKSDDGAILYKVGG
jgi:quercetin dioxygenase-like cupin family protein